MGTITRLEYQPKLVSFTPSLLVEKDQKQAGGETKKVQIPPFLFTFSEKDQGGSKAADIQEELNPVKLNDFG